jgi:hypothetical protein
METHALSRGAKAEKATFGYTRFVTWSLVGKVALSLSALVLIVAASLMIVSQIGDRERSPERSRPRAGWSHQSYGGGYSFAYPGSWSIVEEPSRTSVEHPDRESVVTFDTAPKGGLFVTSGRLVASLRRAYDRVIVEEVGDTSGRGNSGALDLRGEVIRRDGTEMVLIARILKRPGQQPIVATGFAAQGSETAIEQTELIVTSLAGTTAPRSQ